MVSGKLKNKTFDFNVRCKRFVAARAKRSAKASHLPFTIYHSASNNGFTLVELVITIVVLSVLALATIPLVQNAVRRQKEQLLRERLREIRLAIDEFKRDVNGPCSTPQSSQLNTGGGNQIPPVNGANGGGGFNDPRQRVSISDCKIFQVDNLDRYPPTLEILVEGVNVIPRDGGARLQSRGAFSDKNATDIASNATEPKKKVYLRELPIDPVTGENDWKLRSPYQEKDAPEWDSISVFDVRSSAEGETLDGIKYSDL